jgi:acylaminoacyl-peptidase
MATMVYTNDIPDWGFAEALGISGRLPPTEQEIAKMYEASPISKQIVRPVLLGVGMRD